MPRARVRENRGTRAHEFLSDFVGFCRFSSGFVEGRLFGGLGAAGWIPAYAGMTWEGAGMTWVGVGMTWVGVGMTWVGVGMAWVNVVMRRAGGGGERRKGRHPQRVSVVVRRAGEGGGWVLVCFVHGGISLGCGFAEWS